MASLSTLAVSWVAGSLTTLSPCVFPVLPLVLGGAVQGHRLAPLFMGLGMAGSFAVIGLLLGLAGPALGITGDGVRQTGGALLLLFGTAMLVPALDRRFMTLLAPLADAASARSAGLPSGSLWGALGLGALLGLIWSPCSGPLLATALTLVASEGGALSGGLILGLFGLGAATPLVAVAYASRGAVNRWRDRLLRHSSSIKRGFGVLLLLLGVAILTGADKRLEAALVSIMPDDWVALTVRF